MKELAKILTSAGLLIGVFLITGITYQTLLQTGRFAGFMRAYPSLYQHSAMLVISMVLIVLINKGDIKGYGVTINLNFPLLKIIIIGVVLGFTGGLILTLSDFSVENAPWADMNPLQIILLVWIFASIAEEVLFRGLIQGFLEPIKHLGLRVGKLFLSLPVITSAIMFGLIHYMMLSMGVSFPFVTVIVIMAFILGLFAGYYRELSKSLLPAIIIHACFNIGGSVLSFF